MMPTYVQVTIRSAPILGGFSKARKGSKALNYGESGGPDCDTDCAMHPESTSAHARPDDVRCYAWKLEKRPDRKSLSNKLHRHQLYNRESLTALALQEVRKSPVVGKGKIPWFRFSSFGSVPGEVPKYFRQLCEELERRGIDTHLPVESYAKARKYRKVLKGLNIAVRRSCQSTSLFIRASIHNNPLSVVVGSMKQTPRERVAESKRVAKLRTLRTGKPTIVCPAIAAMHLRTGSDKAKCGWCTACADEEYDIVYPGHR